MKTEQWPIEKPTDHPKNYKKHPEKQIKAIRTWLRVLGFIRPVLVQKSSGHIIAGHALRMAARGGPTTEVDDRGKRLKLPAFTEIPVQIVDCDDVTAARFIKADNELGGMAEIDKGSLRGLMKFVVDEGYGGDIEKAAAQAATGWELVQLGELLLEVPPPKPKKETALSPPDLTWFVVAIPTAKWQEISTQAESIGECEHLTICEISSTSSEKH